MNKKHLTGLLVALVAATVFGAWSFVQRRPAIRVEDHPRTVLHELGISSSSRPQLAVSTAGVVYLLAAYEDQGQHRLGLTMSHDGGDTFSAPVAISEPGADVSAHGENGPSLEQRGMAVYALWQQHRADGPTQVMFARSMSMGHFDKPIVVTDKQQPSFNGFSSLAVAPNGDLYAVWLDGRDTSEHGTFSVYLAKSTDRGATFSTNVRVARGACPCCRPGIAIGANGEVYVAWRNVFEGDVRDIVVATSHDAGTTFGEPVRVAPDHWVLHACPEAGPTLATWNGKLFVAWFTQGGGIPEVRLAASTDAGRSFGQAVKASAKVLDPNHPAMSVSEDGALLLTFQGRPRASDQDWRPIQPFVAVIHGDGSVSEPVSVPNIGRSASYPAIAAMSGGRAFIAWTQSASGTSEVALSRARER